jgi:DNA-directed RNA polymerase specialized sigma24 family protein
VSHLNQLINDLPSRKGKLYIRYTQELSVDQIADTLNINYQSANNLLHRGTVKLTQRLERNNLLHAVSLAFSLQNKSKKKYHLVSIN